MHHIHKLIDFTVAVYIVHKGKVLFIHHKELNKWLPIGGHIELHEDPEQGLFREINEETGLSRDQLVVLSDKPDFDSEEQKYLYTPNLLDIHKINEVHKHIGLFYFVRSKSKDLKLSEKEHNEIRWMSIKDLKNKKYNIRKDIYFAAKKAIVLETKS